MAPQPHQRTRPPTPVAAQAPPLATWTHELSTALGLGRSHLRNRLFRPTLLTPPAPMRWISEVSAPVGLDNLLVMLPRRGSLSIEAPSSAHASLRVSSRGTDQLHALTTLVLEPEPFRVWYALAQGLVRSQVIALPRQRSLRAALAGQAYVPSPERLVLQLRRAAALALPEPAARALAWELAPGFAGSPLELWHAARAATSLAHHPS